MKVLIVEDNLEVRKMIIRFIQDIADEIKECGDGDEAFAVYQKFLPDWVLMDIEMKRMSGFAAAKQIKKSFPNAAIVFVTSYNDTNLRTIAQELDASGFVSKENLSILREILAERV